VATRVQLRRDPLALARALLDAFGRNRLLTYASAVAFRTLVALIPLILLAIALLGAVGEQKVWKRTVAPPIEDRVLPRVFGGIDATVETIFRQGGWLLIAFAAALALLDVASAVRSIMSSLNEIAVAEEGRPTWLRFAVSFALAVVVIVCLVGAVLVVSVGGWLAGSSGGVLHLGLGIARWLAAIVLLGLTVAVVVRYGGYRPRSKTWVSIGSGAIVAAWVVLSLAFKWFVASVASYRSGPGILVAFLILTTYVYASAIVFLVGVQLDELVGRR